MSQSIFCIKQKVIKIFVTFVSLNSGCQNFRGVSVGLKPTAGLTQPVLCCCSFASLNRIARVLGLSVTHRAAPQPPPRFLTHVYVFFIPCLAKISGGVSPVVQTMLDYLIIVLCSGGAFFLFAVFYPDQTFL